MNISSGNIILSTAYLPPVSWIKAAMGADIVMIEAHETYPKQTFRNRSLIITANGLIPLSIPVIKVSGQKVKTRDIEISYDEPWQRLHWRSINAAYRNSPFFLYYMDELLPFYEKKIRFLLDFNNMASEIIFKILGATVNLQLTDDYHPQPESLLDLRDSFSPKTPVQPASFTPYHQVFEERHGFIADLSIIDLIFNEGPAAPGNLKSEL